MMAVCFRYSKNKEEAEDILQEGFIKVFKNIHQYKKKGPLGGWIRRIMVNVAIEAYRQKQHSLTLVNIDDVKIRQHSPEDVSSYIGAMELMKMIQNLPPAYQMVFNLYVFEGQKHKEIAKRLGISVGTSKSNLFNARKLLQENILNNKNIALRVVNE